MVYLLGGAAVLAFLVGIFLVVNRPVLIRVDAPDPAEFPAAGFSHQTFELLLRKYVDNDGGVDYQGWHGDEADRRTLAAYLGAVSRYSPATTPARFPRRSDALAYWLYAYNAYVIYSIVENWPLESVTDVRAPMEVVKGLGFFYRQRFLFGGEALSLYGVENDIIRPTYRDPRIHFVLNCASESCPVLRPELPTGDELEALLESSMREFVSDRRNVRVEHNDRQVVLSTIFKWYEKDFINDVRQRGLPTDRGVLEYLLATAPQSVQDELAATDGYKLVFEDYDWGLNVQQ